MPSTTSTPSRAKSSPRQEPLSPTESDDRLNALLSPPTGVDRSPRDIALGLKRIRELILTDGMPELTGRPRLRPRVWKLMLNVDQLYADEYLKYVSMGDSELSTKIKNDTFRTMATDTQFKGKVKEDMLIRLLEAFVWKNHWSERDEMSFTYVQGMNVLCAPFLYAMPTQLEAFACFSNFIETCCPLYVQPTLIGVHRGLKLLDQCLEILDPALFDHLREKNLSAELYAFPSVLTLCACTPPLEEVLQLWDFLLAFGVHLNILCIIAQLHYMRDDLLDSPSPMKLLRSFPPLNARQIVVFSLMNVRKIPEEIYRELVAHPLTL